MIQTNKIMVSADDYPRMWTSDDDFDLIIWFLPSRQVFGFQLCYDKKGAERAFTWKEDAGYSHRSVDGGEEDPRHQRSPTLTPDGDFPRDRIAGLFEERSASLRPDLRDFILQKIRSFPLRTTPG